MDFPTIKNVDPFSRGRNFNLIGTKLCTHIGLIKIQLNCVNKSCGVNRKGRTFFKEKPLIPSRDRNFDQIITKLGSKVGLV